MSNVTIMETNSTTLKETDETHGKTLTERKIKDNRNRKTHHVLRTFKNTKIKKKKITRTKHKHE